MPIQVKICGIRDKASLLSAVKAGANFVGFVDYSKSPRHISAAAAKTLMPLLPAGVSSVVVTVNPNNAWVDQVAFHVAPHFIQLHGNETPKRVAEIRARCIETRIIKAIPIRNADDLKMAADYETCADMLLFDAKPATGQLPGGNGLPFDWTLLADKKFSLPWMLSGGLNAGNVRQAILQSGAALLDVSSGVESAPGVKDSSLIADFIKAAKTS